MYLQLEFSQVSGIVLTDISEFHIIREIIGHAHQV